MFNLRAFRIHIMVIALTVSLVTNATIFVGGVLYRSFDAFLESATGIKTSSINQRREIQRLNKENRRLQKRLDVVRTKALPAAKRTMTRRVKSMTKSVATLPGKALPVLGVTISAAFTVWEIKNLCETISDMNSIRRAIDPSDVADDEESTTLCSIEVPATEEIWEEVVTSPREVWEGSKNHIPGLSFSMSGLDISWKDVLSLWKEIRSFWNEAP